MTTAAKTLVISAVNLVEGGTLTVLQDCVEAAGPALPGWRIVVLAHRRDLVPTAGVEVVELPHIKARWLRRLWAEWVQFKRLSQIYSPDLWLSLHDITPRVVARRQAVYCHNPAPFSRPTLRDAWLGPTYFAFTLAYGHLYRAFIRRNYAVVVQQEWLRKRFQQQFGVKNVIVAQPITAAPAAGDPRPRVAGRPPVFLYPAFPRCFKNFELIGEALEELEAQPGWTGRVRWTLSGEENRYARWLRRRYGHLKTLEWLGLQTRDQMRQHYQSSDCLLFPSRLETWGLPITEAKQQGLPILAADLEYAHETLGSYAAADFFDPHDASGLAQRMLSFSQGRPTTHAVVGPTTEGPVVSDWQQLLRVLTEGL